MSGGSIGGGGSVTAVAEHPIADTRSPWQSRAFWFPSGYVIAFVAALVSDADKVALLIVAALTVAVAIVKTRGRGAWSGLSLGLLAGMLSGDQPSGSRAESAQGGLAGLDLAADLVRQAQAAGLEVTYRLSMTTATSMTTVTWTRRRPRSPPGSSPRR